MSIDETSAERAYARQERDPAASFVTAMSAGVSRWSEAMSAGGRRAATSVAASKCRQWVNRTLGERPTRGELRAWFEMVLDERRELHNRLEKETRAAQEVAGLRRELDAVLAQRDDALEGLAAERDAHDADVAELGDHRDTLKAMLRRAHCERDALRDELASRGTVGRASCSHPVGGAE